MCETPIQKVRLDDSFWSPRLEFNAWRSIFHQWQQLEASGCIDNFRILAGDKPGFREGWFFADSDAFKWLDAAARITTTGPSPELTDLMDDFIALLGRAQAPDGYLYTYNQIHFPTTRWANLQIEHELYCHGHLIEAGVSHHIATSSDSLLQIARRAADRIVQDFREAGPEGTDGHEEIEIALIRLYRLTGEEAYLAQAQRFIEQRGRIHAYAWTIWRQNTMVAKRGKTVKEMRQKYIADHPEHAVFKLPPGNKAIMPPYSQVRSKLSALSGKYFQQHAPFERQKVPVGHAVRFGYLETAAAMLLREKGGSETYPYTNGYLGAMENAWERMVTRRMYVTGGLGSQPGLEGFGNDYDLNPEYAYSETCAALASMFWNWEMALLTGQARYSDLFEWQLYNAAAVGMGLNGESYLYNNPLACRGGVTRKAWYAVPCCPSNLSRTWADLGRYVYSTAGDSLTIHQLIGSALMVELAGTPVSMELTSGLPWDGNVSIQLRPEKPAEFTITLRIPSWAAGSVHIQVNQRPVELPPTLVGLAPTACGYDPRLSCFVPLRRQWSPGDEIEMHLELPIALRRAHSKVKGHTGKAALTRGPLVYCLESIDNPGVDIFEARLRPDSLHAEPAPNLLGGIWVLRGETESGSPVTAIPYALWGNRGESQMNVWVKV
ncbi:MAG TPA: beta-L-arabinofuranosidase domain-containing protein [Anaerolineales bacterium]|nr:beta-L-arabinofuranosidase domain-containing protein [Anaerolineales bacterium]